MTNMAAENSKVLKTDSLGRVKTPPERREKLLDEFERSGLSGVKFAALVGLKYQTLASWVVRRRKRTALCRSASKPVDQVHWLEAVVSEAQGRSMEAAPFLKLHLAGGAWLEIKEAKQVELAAAMVRALERPLPAC